MLLPPPSAPPTLIGEAAQVPANSGPLLASAVALVQREVEWIVDSPGMSAFDPKRTFGGGRFRPLADTQRRLHNRRMLLGLLVLSAVMAGIALIAAIIAALTRLVTKSSALAIAVGTLAIPALLCASFAYWVLTMEVDEVPPGNVLMGNLIAVAIATPIALLASRFAVRALSRRA